MENLGEPGGTSQVSGMNNLPQNECSLSVVDWPIASL